jgi:hypothetical protein
MEYYKALKKEILYMLQNKWTLRDMILSEISQSQKENTVWFYLK